MELTVVKVEKPTSVSRKLFIKVAAQEVNHRFERGLAEVQKTAKLKGFRPGMVPISVVKQYYGADVRHQVFHHVIEDATREALKKEQIRAIGSPQIDTPDHRTGEGAHDHEVKEGQELNFTATVEVLPELDVKGYAGLAATREKVAVSDADVEGVIKNMLDSQAQLEPLGGGLVGADGQSSARPAEKGDYADIAFDGGIVTDAGVERKPGMKGSRIIELGSGDLIPGFEDNVVGMKVGQTKTFRVPFPADFGDKDLAGKESEFTVTVNELKVKKLPTLDDELAKGFGYAGVADLREKVRSGLLAERTENSERKVKSDLLAQIIEKNPFECPVALIEAQTRSIAQDLGGNLKQQGFNEQMIQETLTAELPNIMKRAESQVRASLLLEAIGKKENISVTPAEVDAEVEKMAERSKIEVARLREHYEKNPARRADLEFRMREERTMTLLLGKAKIKG